MKIITLCGSTKFKLEFEMSAKALSEVGWFVHSVEIYGHADNIPMTPEYKKWLEDTHYWKIDRSDAIYVVDVNGYIGDSTKREIEYATKKGIEIFYQSRLYIKGESVE